MQKINDNELKSISGGVSTWSVIGISALAAFIVGIFDGIARPLKCNK